MMDAITVLGMLAVVCGMLWAFQSEKLRLGRREGRSQDKKDRPEVPAGAVPALLFVFRMMKEADQNMVRFLFASGDNHLGMSQALWSVWRSSSERWLRGSPRNSRYSCWTSGFSWEKRSLQARSMSYSRSPRTP